MPWHLDAISVGRSGARQVTETGHGIVVALVDTGVCAGHKFFGPNAVKAVYHVERNLEVKLWALGSPFSYRLAQQDDHGTAVAALICAKTIGVAPAARLVSVVMPFRDSQASTGKRVLASELQIALEHLQHNAVFDILNLSVAFPQAVIPPMLAARWRAIFQDLNDRGVVTVAC